MSIKLDLVPHHGIVGMRVDALIKGGPNLKLDLARATKDLGSLHLTKLDPARLKIHTQRDFVSTRIMKE